MIVNLGKHSFLVEVFSPTDQPLIAMMSQPLTIYRRGNGTHYYMNGSLRREVQQLPDGGFYERVVEYGCVA